MRLVYTCSSCKKTNFFKPKLESRAHLQAKFGDMVRVNCEHCGKMEKKHLNRISAAVDNRLVVGGFIAGLSFIFLIGGYLESMMQGSLSFWKILGVVGSAAAGLPMFLWNNENKAVRNFNRLAIKK